MEISNLHFRPHSHDDQIVFKELVIDDMFQFSQLAEIAKLYPNWACIDGGGHIGLFSLLLEQYIGGDIYTYEPNPDSFQLCKLNTQNKKSIKAIQKGLDIKNGHFKLYPPKNVSDTGSWSMVPSEIHDTKNPIEIETVNLSDIISDMSKSGKNILLKLDLEGFEATIINEVSIQTLECVKILILEEHHLSIDHDKLDKIGFRLLFHPLGSHRHFVYFNTSGESQLVQNLLNLKCHVGDTFWKKKLETLKKNSRITVPRIIAGLKNKLLSSR